ncbi:MAG TPA: AMP-binding protein [Methanotrichaceae archaeon]|nr:AMP-binding protein [Methanotrichaceae archaeon]
MQRRDHRPDNPALPANPFLMFRKDEVEQSIPDRFEQQVAKHPDKLAFKSRQHKLTYDELNQAANRVARAILAQCGAGQCGAGQCGAGNAPIALLVEFGAHEIIGLLGILKAGKALVGMPTTYPIARNSYILEHSQASLIVTDSQDLSLASELESSRLPLVNMDELDPGLSAENLGLSISPDDIASIVYTSGTTGQPKGVIQNHRFLLYNVMNDTNCYHICAGDREINLLSYAFFGGMTIILHNLLNGASIFPFNLKEEGISSLADFLIDEEITTFGAIPSSFRSFVNALGRLEKFPKLRCLHLFGEAAYPVDLEMYRKHFPPSCILYNVMGSTESGTVSRYQMNKETQVDARVIPVGYEDEGMQILLWDETGNEVGFNQVGDIVIKSRYLSPGYWRQPELTRASFLPDPDGGDVRLYRTGDTGLRLQDGCIIYLSRKDSQVKIRGNRIDVSEIETALLSLDWVKEAVVAAREDRNNDQMLVAYVVAARQPAPGISALRRELARKLPDCMIPSAFVMLDALPLNPTGKVDHRMLPMPSTTRPDLDSEPVMPRDSIEQQLIDIWEEVLGIDAIGIRDSFFDLGGSSLLAARMLIQIEKAFGRKLPMATVLKRPTVEQIAKTLRDVEQSRALSSLVPVQTGGPRWPFFCMAGVNTLTDLAHHLSPEQPVYGLMPLNWGDRQNPYARIEEMASHYLQGIRALQPEGPYFLGGHSFGGLVAFEMAHQLQRQGQRVQLLVLIDTYPSFPQKSPKYYSYRVLYHLKRGQLINRLASKARRLLPLSQKDLHYNRYWSAISTAIDSYTLQAYPGKIVLFNASESLDPDGVLRDARLDWARIATGGLEVYQIPGDHITLLEEPNLRILAEKLRGCLDEAASD